MAMVFFIMLLTYNKPCECSSRRSPLGSIYVNKNRPTWNFKQKNSPKQISSNEYPDINKNEILIGEIKENRYITYPIPSRGPSAVELFQTKNQVLDSLILTQLIANLQTKSQMEDNSLNEPRDAFEDRIYENNINFVDEDKLKMVGTSNLERNFNIQVRPPIDINFIYIKV